MTPDLGKLKRLAEEAAQATPGRWKFNVNPATVLALIARIEALEGERDDMQSRYILRMADIREASGVGHKPMLDEVAGAIRSRVEALERALEAARSLPLMQAELSEIEDMPCHAKDARKLRKDIKAAEALVRTANLLGDRHD